MTGAELYHVRMPMAVAFDHSAARRRRSDSLVLRLRLPGAEGVGECAPRRYVTGETCDSVRAELTSTDLRPVFDLLGTEEPDRLLRRTVRDGAAATFGLSGGNNLVCLLELAVLDVLGKRTGRGVAELLADPAAGTPDRLPISQVLDLSLGVEEFLATRGPFSFVKVKASNDIERDLRTVRVLRDAIGPGVPVLVDANMSWTPPTATANAARLRAAGATMVEEPLAPRSWRDLRDLRSGTGLAVMLDESASHVRDVRAAVTGDAADAINVRVAKCGGLIASATMIRASRAAGLAFQIGAQAAEVGPLIAAGRHLAFAFPDALTVEAGQSDRQFRTHVVTPAPVVDRAGNTIGPPGAPGLGLTLDDAIDEWLVARYRDGWRDLSEVTA